MENTRRRLIVERLEQRQLMASVSMPTVAIGPEGQAVAELRIDDATGVRAAEIRIHYDPNKLQTNQESIRAGALWNDKASVVAKVDETAGIITAFVYTAEPIDGTFGNLLEISFEPRNHESTTDNVCGSRSRQTLEHPRRFQSLATSATTVAIDVQEVRLNEGQITLIDEPIVGPDPTDGEILTSATSSRDFRDQRRNRFHGPMQPENVDTVMQDFHKPWFRQQIIARRRG